MRVSTGSEGLDKLLEGGFVLPSVVLAIGPPGSGKSTFCKQFLYKSLSTYREAVYVATKEDYGLFDRGMKNLGWVLDLHKDYLHFIDAHSWKRMSPTDAVLENRIRGLTKLNELNHMIKSRVGDFKGKEGVIIIDSLSDLFLHNESKSVFKFVELLGGMTKEKNLTTLLVVEKGLHHKKEYNTLDHLTDGTIELGVFGGERVLRITRMAGTKHPLDAVKFKINKGLEVFCEKFVVFFSTGEALE